MQVKKGLQAHLIDPENLSDFPELPRDHIKL